MEFEEPKEFPPEFPEEEEEKGLPEKPEKQFEELRKEIRKLRAEVRVARPKWKVEGKFTPALIRIPEGAERTLVESNVRGRLYRLSFRTKTTGFSLNIKLVRRGRVDQEKYSWTDLVYQSDMDKNIDLEQEANSDYYMFRLVGKDRWNWSKGASFTIEAPEDKEIKLKLVTFFYQEVKKKK